MLSTLILQPMGYLGKLVILSVFSMGLSIHTRVVENHYKNWFNVAACGLALLATTGFGIYEVVQRHTAPLSANPNGSWVPNADLKLPVMAANINIELSPWMPLTVDFKVVESCDAVPQNCEPLMYQLSLVATKGFLKLSDSDKVSSEIKAEGTVAQINEALGKSTFLAECNSEQIGQAVVAVELYAWGNLDKSTADA